MSHIEVKDEISKENIVKTYYKSCKKTSDFKIGIEYERSGIFKKSFLSVPYHGKSGILNLLKIIAKEDNWEFLYDFDNIIGLKKNNDTITLEPGCQLEISLSPKKNLYEIENEINSLNKKIKLYCDKQDILLLEYGINPVSHHGDIEIVPKKRYECMHKYFPLNLAPVMMKQTSGIQVIFDFENEDDAIKKLTLTSKLSPIVSAIFANSPIYNKEATGYKSYRALSWIYLDDDRCGFADSNMFENYSFEKYVEKVLSVPMIFIVRNGLIVEINGKINFNEFIKNGYFGFKPTYEDYLLHSSLFFPDVRLKNYIEIRNHDCQKGNLKYAIAALYKGLFSNYSFLTMALEFINVFTKEELYEARIEAAKYALDGNIGNYKISDIALNILKLAYDGLEDDIDKGYLEPIMELTFNKLSPADIILKNWYGCWNRDFSKFINYIISS